MNVHGYPRKFMGISWKFMDLYAISWTAMEFYAISVEFHESARHLMEIDERSWNSVWIPWTFIDFREFSCNFTKFHAIPWVFIKMQRNCIKISGISRNFMTFHEIPLTTHPISMGFHGNQWRFHDSSCYSTKIDEDAW